MNHFLLTKSGHEIEINDEQKRSLERVIKTGGKYITVDGNMISVVDVAGIYDAPKSRRGMYYCNFGNWHTDGEPCGCYESKWAQTIAEESDHKKLEAGNRCRGQYSIQHEINQIAFHEHKKTWRKVIKDKAWREETRQKLLATGATWCDYKTGDCYCEPGYKPDFIRHNYQDA